MQFGLGHRALTRLSMHDLMLFSLTGVIFCWVVSRYVTGPLAKLNAAAASIAQGYLSTRVDPSVRNRKDEIADLADSFDEMAERIEALVNGQRRLLSDVSHELRSPLSRLTVAIGLLKQGPSDDSAEYLERIALEAHRLNTMIGQLLALTRLDSGVDGSDLQQFDLTNLVQEVASDGDFEARARNRSVVIRQADPCSLKGYEEPIRSAVENLIRNAIRYTAEAMSVEVSIEVQGSSAMIRIRDFGPGVPDAFIPEIFVPFRRASNSYSDGAGLGLAIAERAVHLHRGKIRAMNAAGGGLVVEIYLPI